MKRIHLLYTGGTFGMMPLSPGETLAPADLTDAIARYLPESLSLADITTETLFNLDSSNMHIPHWIRLAESIAERLDDYDGFVIVHGTDAMAYTATALSFMLMNLPKPVILTGSQRPIAALRTDARMNLINAIELAGHDIPEVAILFNNFLLRGNRTIKMSSTHYDAFHSPNFGPLAEIGLDIEIKGTHLEREGFFNVQKKFDDRVLLIKLFPGLQPRYLEPLIDSDVKGIVIEAFGLGNVPINEKSLLPFISAAVAARKVVVIASQVPHGFVDLARYDCGLKAMEAGAVSAGDMTTIAAIVKLMFLFGQLENPEAVKSSFQRAIAGEMSMRTKKGEDWR